MSQAVAQQVQSKSIAKKGSSTGVRLWARAKFLGFRRSKVQQNVNQSILRIEGVNDRAAAQYYFGKRVTFVYKVSSGEKDNRFKTIWGRISRAHGNTGAVLARFRHNLPPRAIGATLRVMLFPQRAWFVLLFKFRSFFHLNKKTIIFENRDENLDRTMFINLEFHIEFFIFLPLRLNYFFCPKFFLKHNKIFHDGKQESIEISIDIDTGKVVFVDNKVERFKVHFWGFVSSSWKQNNFWFGQSRQNNDACI